MEPIDDEFLGGFGIKKTSEDKLTYKNIIADAINWCRKNRGRKSFRDAVEGLIDIISFDVPGYKLLSSIEQIKKDVKQERDDKSKIREKKVGSSFNSNAYQAKFKLEMDEWYWNRFFIKIIQLLADHNLLIETEKVTKIRIKQPVEDDDEFEGSTSDMYE